MELYQGNLLYRQTYDTVANDRSCIGGFCNAVLAERPQGF